MAPAGKDPLMPAMADLALRRPRAAVTPEESGMKLSTLAVSLLAALALGVSDLLGHVGAAQAAPSRAWLDSAAPNWNQAGAPVPQSPAPRSPAAQSPHNQWTGAGSPDGPSILTSSPEEKKYFERCKSFVRPGTLPEDTLLEDAGWVLFGEADVFGKITVVMAMAAVENGCRGSSLTLQRQCGRYSDLSAVPSTG